MINSYDDLKAQRAQAHNDLQVAKSRLTADTREWQDVASPLNVVGMVAKNLFSNKLTGGTGKKGLIGKGVQLGFNALLSRTILKRLPFPFNMFLPHAIENAAINFVDSNGRDYLIKALEWVKEVTEEKNDLPLLMAHVETSETDHRDEKLTLQNTAYSDGTVEIKTVPAQ